MKLFLNGFGIPQIVSDEFLFELAGDRYNDSKLDIPVSLEQIKEILAEETIEGESITIDHVFELFINSLATNDDGELDTELKAQLESCVGRVIRYTNAQGSLITSFVSSGVYYTAEKGLYFNYIKDGFERPLEFLAANPKKSLTLGTWTIGNTGFISQKFDQVVRENPGRKTVTSSLNCSVEDVDTGKIHDICIRINTGLSEKEARKNDSGNVIASDILSSKILRSGVDFSDCVLPENKGGGGFKSDIRFLLDGYLGNKFNECVFQITGLSHRYIEKKDGTGKFSEFIATINTSILPDGLKLTAFDFATKGTQKLDATAIGSLQLPENVLRMAWSKVQKGTVELPSESKPWHLHIKGVATRTNPPMNVWTSATVRLPDDVLQKFEASKSIAFWGGTDYATVVQLQQEIIPDDIDLDDDDSEDLEDTTNFLHTGDED